MIGLLDTTIARLPQPADIVVTSLSRRSSAHNVVEHVGYIMYYTYVIGIPALINYFILIYILLNLLDLLI